MNRITRSINVLNNIQIRGWKSKIDVPLSKIVATIGPASENLPVLPAVVEAGMRIMRINFSHATYDEADLRMKNLNHSPGLHQTFNIRAVMLDTQGPEIRTGIFNTESRKQSYNVGDEVIVTTDPDMREKQSKDVIWISYTNIYNVVKVGHSILLDDGALELVVMSKDANSTNIKCQLRNGGELGNRKGVNIPGVELEGLPAMSEKDKQDIVWGIKNDIDYIAASFVRRASDVTEIRDYATSLVKKHRVPGSLTPLIISKIESTEALDNIDSIIQESDAIMVARGDLGVEIPVEDLTMVQKDLVTRCNEQGKPVIVATQMLESMQKNPRPTRAECTDVANAIYDGADCVMLSGESAKGKYPVPAVTTMDRIVKRTEAYERTHSIKKTTVKPTSNPSKIDATAAAVVKASNTLDARAIIVIAESGNTAKRISMMRPHVPIITYVKSNKIGRMLQLYRGIHPIVVEVDELGSKADTTTSHSSVINHTKRLGLVDVGDNLIVVSATGAEEGIGSSVSMSILTLE